MRTNFDCINGVLSKSHKYKLVFSLLEMMRSLPAMVAARAPLPLAPRCVGLMG